MNHQISARSSTPQQISLEDRTALTRAHNSLTNNELLEPVSVDLRDRLSSFLASTSDRTQPATLAQIETEVAVLMMAFYSARTTSKAEATAMMQVYAEVLQGLPLWAIKDGFAKIKAGQVEGASLDFPPAAPRLKQVVVEVMQPLMLDRYHAQKVLSARVAPAENPEMSEAVRKLVADAARARAAEMREADAADMSPRGQERPAFRPPSIADCAEIYKTRRLPGLPPRDQPGDGGVAVDDQYATYLRSAVRR